MILQGMMSIKLVRTKVSFQSMSKDLVRFAFNTVEIVMLIAPPLLALKLQVVLDMNIAGLPSHPTAGISIDADCPFELPQNAP
jgi:hypothetical protein